MPVTGRIVKPVDFERVLGAAARWRSEHFVVHHLPDVPSRPSKRSARRPAAELSTEDAPRMVTTVDDLPFSTPAVPPIGTVWLGLVVPKRHARRAVSRTLFKRQMRACVGHHAAQLPGGLWVVRLRAPFDKALFPSAASVALQRAARAELERLMVGAARLNPVKSS